MSILFRCFCGCVFWVCVGFWGIAAVSGSLSYMRPCCSRRSGRKPARHAKFLSETDPVPVVAWSSGMAPCLYRCRLGLFLFASPSRMVVVHVYRSTWLPQYSVCPSTVQPPLRTVARRVSRRTRADVVRIHLWRGYGLALRTSRVQPHAPFLSLSCEASSSLAISQAAGLW